MTPPDDAPLSLRLLALMGVGGGISTAAEILRDYQQGIGYAP